MPTQQTRGRPRLGQERDVTAQLTFRVMDDDHEYLMKVKENEGTYASFARDAISEAIRRDKELGKNARGHRGKSKAA